MESSSQLGGVFQLNARENAFALGRKVDSSFSSNDSHDLLEVLQKASTEDLYNVSEFIKFLVCILQNYAF